MKNRLVIAVYGALMGLFICVSPAKCDDSIVKLLCELTGGVWDNGECVNEEKEPDAPIILKVTAIENLTIQDLNVFPTEIILTDIPHAVYDIYALIFDKETDTFYIARNTLLRADTFVIQHSPSIHPYRASQTGSEQKIDIFDVCISALEANGGLEGRYIFYLGVALPDTVENCDFSSLLAAAFEIN